MENDATKTVRAVVFSARQWKEKEGQRRWISCTAAWGARSRTLQSALPRKTLALGEPMYRILVTTDLKQGLFSLCSMAALLALEGNPFTDFPWSLKRTYLVWNATKWDLIPLSTVFIPLPERARVSLEILQIWQMLKKRQQTWANRKIDTPQIFRLIRPNISVFEVMFSTDSSLPLYLYYFTPAFSATTGAPALYTFPSFISVTGEVLYPNASWPKQLCSPGACEGWRWWTAIMSLYWCWHTAYVLRFDSHQKGEKHADLI